VISGISCIAGAAWFLTRMKTVKTAMRPVYEQLGIIPAKYVPEVQEAGRN
jgi:hypothetical protein